MDDATRKLVDEARRAQKAVYLATDKLVADDLSRIIGGLADGLEAVHRTTISPEVRDEVRSAVGSVLANASNYPEATQPHILGRDLSELIEAKTDALLARFALPELDPERVVDANPCGDWPAPCNCDDPETHDLTKNGDAE